VSHYDSDDEPEDDYDDEDDEPTVPCPWCRREILEDSPRCPYCEKYISAEDAPPTPKPWWIIITAVVCLYLIVRCMI
jgi:hypothetical protein